jgi:carbonic anhydrase/acetyltransferase-like protein (isoleucine patch superfamily)
MGYNEDYEGAKTNGHRHANGGGFVASTAKVAATAYVGPHAKVLGYATVSDSARIKDYAIVKGSAKISGNAEVNENAMVLSNAEVTGNAVVSGEARVFNGSVISGDAFVTDNAFIDATKVYGNAICCGNLWQRDYNSYEIGGTAVCGGDMEKAGYITTGKTALLKGTYLQEPNSDENGRSYADGVGNLNLIQLKNLKKRWNEINLRYSTLSYSYSGNTDINRYYSYFKNSAMAIDTVNTPIEQGHTYRVVEQPLNDGNYYIMNTYDGTVLTYDGTLYPKLQALDEDNDTNSVWTITKLDNGKYKMFNCASGNRYLNYNGQLSLYTPSFNTFYVYRRSDQQNYAVRNNSNNLYWAIANNTFKGTSSSRDGFPVRFVKKSDAATAVEIIRAGADDPIRTEYYTIDGIRQNRPHSGVNIVKKIYRDGHEESTKVSY